MPARLLVQWKGLPETSASRLSGGAFHLHACKLDISCATGILACVPVPLNMHSTSILGIVCLFCYFLSFFEFLIINLNNVYVSSSIISYAWSLYTI